MKRFIIALALLCAGLPSFAQSTIVAGTNVKDNSGNLLASGQWCFGASCSTVTSGAFSGSVTSGTGTITIVNGATTYLTIPGATVAGSYFSWNTYVVPSSASIAGLGVPYIACTPGAVYTQTDGALNQWQCMSINGAGSWNGVAPQPTIVSKIVAGSNVTISPSGGTGTVTISAPAPGLATNNPTFTGTLSGPSANISGTVAAGGAVAPYNIPLATTGLSQGTISSPIVYDTFQQTAGSSLNGQTAQSGNSVWSVSGANASTAVISTGAPGSPAGYLLDSAYGGGGDVNFYASLRNTSVVGGTPQQITTMGGSFILCAAQGSPLNQNQTVTLIAQDANISLTNLAHLIVGAYGWTLQAGATVGGFSILGTGSFPTPLAADCKSSYSLAMTINQAGGTIQAFLPDGESPLYTYAPMETFSLPMTVGTWQEYGYNGAVEGRWGSVWMGGPSQSEKQTAIGGAAAAATVLPLNGNYGTARHVFPAIVIPNAAGGGGTGWYRLATQATFGTFLIQGDFTVSAITSAGNQVLKFSAGSTASTASPYIAQTLDAGQFNVIDQCRLSNDGSTNVALDCHIASAFTTYAVTLNILGVGNLSPLLSVPSVGATAYTNASTFTASIQGANPSITLSGGAGWYTLLTAGTTYGGYRVSGWFSMVISTPSIGSQFVDLRVDNSATGCSIQSVSNAGQQLVGYMRCSWNGTTAQVDVDDLQSATYPLTITPINWTGSYGWTASPTVGATVLTSGSKQISVYPSAAVPYNYLITDGTGWHTIATANTGWGGYRLSGDFQLLASSTLTSGQLLSFHVEGSTTFCNILPNSSTAAAVITQLRCSWSGSAVQLDFYNNVSSTYPITVTGTQIGQFSLTNNPVTGATVLGSGSTLYTVLDTAYVHTLPIVAAGMQNVSGCSVTGAVGGVDAGKFASGTTGTCTVVITPGFTAPNGYRCSATDLTTPADVIQQSATSTTTCTIAGTTASGDVVTWQAIAF